MQHLLALRPKAVNYLKVSKPGFTARLNFPKAENPCTSNAVQMTLILQGNRTCISLSPVKMWNLYNDPILNDPTYTRNGVQTAWPTCAVPLGTRSLFWYSFKHLYWLTVPLSGVWRQKLNSLPLPYDSFWILRQGWLLLSLLWVYALIIKL